MSASLARHSYVSLRCVYRRLLFGMLILAMLGAAWRLCRPYAVVALARSSVGCPGRGPLLAAALRQMGHVLPADARLFDADYAYEEQDLRTHSLPRPGWIAWCAWERREDPDNEREPRFVCTLRFADAGLRARGSLTWSVGDEIIDPWAWPMLAGPPGDYDGDGRWEIVLKLNWGPTRPSHRYAAYAVIRLGDPLNQVAAYIVVDWASKPRPFLHALWHDGDGDGSTELTLVSVNYWRDAADRLRRDPLQTHAVFAWTRPGGILVPKELPPDGGVYSCTFIDDDVAAVPHADDVTPTLRRLHSSITGGP